MLHSARAIFITLPAQMYTANQKDPNKIFPLKIYPERYRTDTLTASYMQKLQRK